MKNRNRMPPWEHLTKPELGEFDGSQLGTDSGHDSGRHCPGRNPVQARPGGHRPL